MHRQQSKYMHLARTKAEPLSEMAPFTGSSPSITKKGTYRHPHFTDENEEAQKGGRDLLKITQLGLLAPRVGLSPRTHAASHGGRLISKRPVCTSRSFCSGEEL